MNETGDDLREPNDLAARCLDLETRDRPIAILRKDSPVCRSEGFDAHARVRLESEHGQIIATLYQTHAGLLGVDEIGLSTAAWRELAVRDGDRVHVRHPRPLKSTRHVRGKVYGRRLTAGALHRIMTDVVAGRYDDIELAMLLTAVAAREVDAEELVALTDAMVDVGERLDWDASMRMDKHCIGGLPGNRTTPLVVAIVAANGLVIPKTSSRAITSPAGTADTMETMAPVNLDLGTMRRVVESEGGCVVWGGAVRLSPADDILIRVARVMDLDAEAQLVGSVLSKKIAAGATHVVLDLPVGETAKVRDPDDARRLADRLCHTASAFGLTARAEITDGRQPVGRGIGPALEARDVLAVLARDHEAPADLRERAVRLAGTLLEMAGTVAPGEGARRAAETLASGEAERRFCAICEAQGGRRTPPEAKRRHVVEAATKGRITAFDNRSLARVAKLAGAPGAPAAGVELHVHLDDAVDVGQPLYTIHAETRGELDYAREFTGPENDHNGRIVAVTSEDE